MNFNLEQIEMLRERTNATYEEAKEALELYNGDMVEALIYLERQNKVKKNTSASRELGFFASVKQLIKKCHQIKFLIKKNDTIVINLPLTIVIVVSIIMTPFVVVGLLAALITNHKIKFEKPDGGDMEINNTMDRVSTAVTTATTQIVQSMNNNQSENK
jgi:hypothetical protein